MGFRLETELYHWLRPAPFPHEYARSCPLMFNGLLSSRLRPTRYEYANRLQHSNTYLVAVNANPTRLLLVLGWKRG
ncbi:hypothetical protein [Pseudomonas amygdali]|uniref:hypothetical protein n=1 Tax=Pseudomonas amygdali TaxID=47877 RepID=UPI001FB73443|nr:hypothetical protein [Pseudomonas amygdali]UPT37680.1 hypothetical protein LT107_03135 [Pseudomonas amygdali pv. loropetali]